MTLPVGSVTGFLRMLGAAEFDAAVAGAQKSMNLAAGSALKMAGAVDKTDAALARSRSTTLSASAAAQKFRAEQLSATAATERYNAALASGTASAARLAAAEASMIRANERVAASMRANAAATAQSQAAMVASVTSAGKKMSKAITLPVVALAAVSVHEAAQFQKSMTLIQTAGGESAANAEAISKGVLKVAQDTGTSLDQLGQGIYTVAKAGAQKWSATEQIEVLRAAAQGAKAENVDLGVSVDALTSVMLGYNMSASQAVQAENQIIRASGLSKTSMQEFAGSLANVVPLASSLGISFAQVAGAEATMTQHGETAQRATDNLSNLITNLAGQNNIAAQAMQQLGIKTVDLQKNLSTRGLTGTLKVVEDHIAKSSKAGLVVVSAFKKAQNATSDLQVELDHMSGALKVNSKAFADGKMSYSDYRKFVRDLGGDQYALGKDFMSTVTAAQGFNTQLRSGNADVRTTATELQKMLGGVTGMRTALMLGGTSAHQFASNVKEVQKASLEAGADVLGWNKTQDTLAVKTDKAKASLQVLAVEIGDELIPAVSKLADEGVKAVQWVGGLSHTQKEVLAWSVGVLAAMGPVLSIGGRLAIVGKGIGTFTATSAAKLATLAGASEASSLRIATSMRVATSALAGAGIGVALGEITKNSSNTTKAMGALGAAATGAAIGFGAGGPLGAAIGGTIGGLSDLAVGFFHSGDAASKASQQAIAAMKAERQTVQDLTSAIEEDSGAIGENTRAYVAKKLQDQGVLTAAQQLHISLTQVTSAALGNAAAQDAVVKKVQDYIGAVQQLYENGAQLTPQQEKLFKAASLVNSAFTDTSSAVGKAMAKYQQLGHAIGGVTAKQIDNQNAMHAQLTTIGRLQSELTALGRTKTTPKVSAEITGLQINLKSAKSQLSKLANEKPTPKVDAQISRLVSSIAAAQKKIDSLHQSRTPKVEVNTAEAAARLKAIAAILNGLHGKTLAVNVAVATSGGIGGHHASGGYIAGAGTGTSDSIPARLSNGEYVVNARQTSRHRAMLDAINYGSQGFAAGGSVGGISTTTAGGKTSYVYGGIQYASLSAAENAQTRAAQSVTKAMNALGHELPKFLASLNQSTSQLHSAEQTLIKDLQNAHATHAQMALVHADLVQLNALARERDRINARLGTAPSAPTAYDKLATAQGAYNQTASSVAQAFMSGFNITSAGAVDPNAPWVQARLALGMPIPGQSGSSILAALQGQLATDRKYKGELKTLGKEDLSKSLLAQLAQAGPDQGGATVAALIGASQSQINTLTLKYGQLQKLSNAAGKQTADVVNGEQLKAAQAQVNELKKMERTLDARLATLGKKVDTIGAQVAHSLTHVGQDGTTRARGKGYHR